MLEDISQLDLGWLSGILEGEGTFTTFKTKSQHYLYPRVSVSSTDEDVIERLYNLAGGNMKGPYFDTRKPHYKPFWNWQLLKIDEVIPFVKAIRPLMSKRRQEAIDQLLLNYQTHLIIKEKKREEWLYKTRNRATNKLNLDLAREIRVRYGPPRGKGHGTKYKGQITIGKLADEYGVTATTIQKIISGEYYADL